MPKRRAAAALTAVALTAGLTGCARTAADAAERTTTSDASSFFSRYVAADGRVVRLDQGSDTVSEGQSYALLIALTTGDAKRFATVWAWTQKNLLRPDGLLAWRWSKGQVVDAMPATDADLDTAVALLRAADTFKVAAYRRYGAAMAKAVLTYETVAGKSGSVVVAGPWATGDPATLNPSYVVAGTASYLAAATGDARWKSVASTTAAIDTQLAKAAKLPPDWASLTAGTVTATGSPDGSTQAQYGLDAVRLPIRLAASCRPADRALAAKYAARLGPPGAVGARTLDGTDLVTWRNAATDIALYAARTAAGNTSGAAAALQSARRLNDSTPTYYGAAWIALGPLLLSNRTGDCS